MDKKAVEGWILEHYRDNPKILDIAQMFHYSETYFNKIFRREFGITPKQYILELRLEEARRLLEEWNVKPSWLFAELGFSDHSTFIMQFKRKFGLTPKEYRNRSWGLGNKS